MTLTSVDNEVIDFHQQIIKLVKKYQFRDRNQICCHGVSVSQCYILEALSESGQLTMNELARRMHLKISTVTRVVDQLVDKGYVTREEDDRDRRIRFIRLTPEGRKLYSVLWKDVLESERAILENFEPKQRKLLLDFLRRLNAAVDSWQERCSSDSC